MLPAYRDRAEREPLAAAAEEDGLSSRSAWVRLGALGPWLSTLTVRINSVPQCLHPCVISSRPAANIVGLIEVTVIRPPQ
jgi:hypothetical protein